MLFLGEKGLESCLHTGPTVTANHLSTYLSRYRYIKNWKEVLQPLNPFISLYVPAVKLLLC